RPFRTHPGELTFGQLARCRNAAARRLGKVIVAIEVLPELSVTDGSHGGMSCMQVTPRPQGAHFFEETCFHHAVKPQLQPPVQHLTVGGSKCPGSYRVMCERTDGFPLQLRDRASRHVTNFESTLNPLRVATVDAHSRLRVQTCQFRVQSGPTFTGGPFV